MSEYLVIIEHEGDSWGAYAPDLPGVGVVGDTRDEVERLIGDRIPPRRPPPRWRAAPCRCGSRHNARGRTGRVARHFEPGRASSAGTSRDVLKMSKDVLEMSRRIGQGVGRVNAGGAVDDGPTRLPMRNVGRLRHGCGRPLELVPPQQAIREPGHLGHLVASAL